MMRVMVLHSLYLIVRHMVLGYPYDIEVTDIKSTSAALRWKSTENVVKDFQIHCGGSQRYKTHDGDVLNTEMHMRSQYVPEGLTNVVIGGLRPNYNYSCFVKEKVEEGTHVFNGIVSEPVIFCTDVGAPEELDAPIIKKEGGITYVYLRQLTHDKIGPVTGYAVQFHLVTHPALNDIPIEYDRLDPFGKIGPIHMEYARASEQPMSFQILFKESLPDHIQIDYDLLRGALKNGAVYRVIIVPYVKSKSSGILFTPSKPSVSFVAVGIDYNDFEPTIKEKPESDVHIKLAVVAGILLPLFCLTYMCCIGSILLSREYCSAPKQQEEDIPQSCCQRYFKSIRRQFISMHIQCLICCGRCCRYRYRGFELLHLSNSDEADRKSDESPTVTCQKHRAPHPRKHKERSVLHPNTRVDMGKIKQKKKCKHKVKIGDNYLPKQKLPSHHKKLRSGGRHSERRFTTPVDVQEMDQDHDIENPLYREKKHETKKQHFPAQSNQNTRQERTKKDKISKRKHCKDYQHLHSEPRHQCNRVDHSDYHVYPDLRYPHGVVPSQHSDLKLNPTTHKPSKQTTYSSQTSTGRGGNLNISWGSTDACQERTKKNCSHQSVETPLINYTMTASASKKGSPKISKLKTAKLSPTIVSASSQSTLIAEEGGHGQALEYTTSASILEKPLFNHNGYFSLLDSDTDVLSKPFTRKSEQVQPPVHRVISPTEKANKNASSTDGLDFVSLSSSLSHLDGKSFKHTLDILH